MVIDINMITVHQIYRIPWYNLHTQQAFAHFKYQIRCPLYTFFNISINLRNIKLEHIIHNNLLT